MHRLCIRRTLRKLLSPELVHEVARDTGACVRLRKGDPFALVWTLMLGSMSGRVRQLSELRRMLQRVTLEESSFYDRFTPELGAAPAVDLRLLRASWSPTRAQ